MSWEQRTTGEDGQAWDCEVLRLVQAKGPSGVGVESWPLWKSSEKKKKNPVVFAGIRISPQVITGQNNYCQAAFLVYCLCIGLFKQETEALCQWRRDWSPACGCTCSSAGSVFHCNSVLQAPRNQTPHNIFPIQRTAMTCSKLATELCK